MATVTNYYILFDNHTQGMAMHSYLRKHGADVKICPVPRALSSCCGMSLLVAAEDVEKVRKLAAESGVEYVGIEGLEQDINPHRDRYC